MALVSSSPLGSSSSTSSDGARNRFVERVRELLASQPPKTATSPGADPAAVLIGLFAGTGGEPRVWLVLRPTSLRRHSGQVALPGGKKDPGDRDLVHTALREADEEIGLPPGHVEVLGSMDDLVTHTGFVITPIVGWLESPFDLRPNPSEVSRVFSAPLMLFAEPGLLEMLPFEPIRRLGRVYRVEGETVWGATAMMLGNLARRLKALESLGAA